MPRPWSQRSGISFQGAHLASKLLHAGQICLPAEHLPGFCELVAQHSVLLPQHVRGSRELLQRSAQQLHRGIRPIHKLVKTPKPLGSRDEKLRLGFAQAAIHPLLQPIPALRQGCARLLQSSRGCRGRGPLLELPGTAFQPLFDLVEPGRNVRLYSPSTDFHGDGLQRRAVRDRCGAHRKLLGTLDLYLRLQYRQLVRNLILPPRELLGHLCELSRRRRVAQSVL
mmetsp:Transcript_17418/g.66347  ORF Transcript_17418/g.66347 Transcript_17418/m.66347 type:complete len:225 (+) Transcript_17418:611-1285(+)|eukprot:scaffold447_cov307-Pinguiococcus_pyrenoidosus.AAC.18